MKLANVRIGAETRAALVVGEELVDLTAQLGVACSEVTQFLGMGVEGRRLAELAALSSAPRLPVQSADLRAPVIPGDKLFGVGMNYHSFVAGARRLNMPVPDDLIWFLRPRSCLTGPFDEVRLPRGATDLDYEVELALVIGERCHDADRSGAARCIAGYMVANDLTLRTRVLKSPVLGKSYDTHTPIGPWLITADELGDVQDLAIRAWVNGELRQDSSTKEMVVDCCELVARISRVCTLRPGDILLTGTPIGSGIFQSPPSGLRSGDIMRMEIEGIGVIENRVVDEPQGV